MRAPFERDDAEGPYDIQRDLQESMHTLVGIIRTESELLEARERIDALKQRAAGVGVYGHQQYNPGWHLAIDLKALLTVSEATARAATCARRAVAVTPATTTPVPTTPEWGTKNVVIRQGADGEMEVTTSPLPEMPADLQRLLEE